MDVLAGQAEVGDGRRNLVPLWNEVRPRSRLADFAPLLGGVVFVGEAALRLIAMDWVTPAKS